MSAPIGGGGHMYTKFRESVEKRRPCVLKKRSDELEVKIKDTINTGGSEGMQVSIGGNASENYLKKEMNERRENPTKINLSCMDLQNHNHQ